MHVLFLEVSGKREITWRLVFKKRAGVLRGGEVPEGVKGCWSRSHPLHVVKKMVY